LSIPSFVPIGSNHYSYNTTYKDDVTGTLVFTPDYTIGVSDFSCRRRGSRKEKIAVGAARKFASVPESDTKGQVQKTEPRAPGEGKEA
jgi:hypothetical protein